MEDVLSYKSGDFEGPLDLLLFLISKNKLNINDIEISLLVDQYLEQVELLKIDKAETASEFLQMASRLIYLKTVSLLPKSEETEQLKEQLSQELIEYETCKKLAKALSERSEGFDRFPKPPEKIEFDNTYELKHPAETLFTAYFDAVGRGKRKLPPSPTVFTKIVAKKVVSVSSRVVYVLRDLSKKGKIKIYSLFKKSTSRSELVATFLAVLELCKADRVKISGDGELAEINAVKEKEQ